MVETRTPCNQWGEPDETPLIGQWHVRHSISAARDTGYLFGKNFVTLREALDFCAKQEGQCRLLTHVEGDGWLWISQPFQSYFVPGAEPTPVVSPTELADRVCHKEQMDTWSSEVAESLAMGGWLREHLSYEDKLDFYADLMHRIRDIVESAFDHPELKGAALVPPAEASADPEKLRRLVIGLKDAAGFMETAACRLEFLSLPGGQRRDIARGCRTHAERLRALDLSTQPLSPLTTPNRLPVCDTGRE